LEYEKETGEKPEYIIFTDGDWRMYDGFSEEKILNMLSYMEKDGLDFLFERPAPIGPHKLEPEQSFFREKLYDYDVFEHTKWDEAHVVNEQFLVFKNNWKFKFFVQNRPRLPVNDFTIFCIWENGIKSPLYIKWAGKTSPAVQYGICSINDIFPTIVGLAGIDMKNRQVQLDGEDLMPLEPDAFRGRQKSILQ
jgi:hypothetical protein